MAWGRAVALSQMVLAGWERGLDPWKLVPPRFRPPKPTPPPMTPEQRAIALQVGVELVGQALKRMATQGA